MHRVRLRRLLRSTFKRKRGFSWLGGVGAIVAAVGGIVLSQGQTHAHPVVHTTPVTPVAQLATPASGTLQHGPLTLNASWDRTAVLAHGNRIARMEVTLNADGTVTERTPIAMAIVVDTSGSMSGEKIQQAQNAVLQTVERMNDQDQLAIVAYNSSARMVVPFGAVGTRRALIRSSVLQMGAGGGTQIPNGMALGYQALEEAPTRFARRIVLLSDGIDGSGIGAPGAKSRAQTYRHAGVTTSALGIGLDYDETFLMAVAEGGRGEYAFLANGSELNAFLSRELNRASNTVADAIAVNVNLPAGFSLVRALGSSVEGNRVPIGPMSAGEQRRVTLEIQTLAADPGAMPAVELVMSYRKSELSFASATLPLQLSAVATQTEADASRVADVFARAEASRLEIDQQRAITLWQNGDRAGASQLAQGNAAALRELEALAPSPALTNQIAEVERDSERFQNVAPASAAGRSFRLRSNSRRRARINTGSWQ